MSGIQQRCMPEPAHGALTTICSQDQVPKAFLVEPLLHSSSRIRLERYVTERVSNRCFEIPMGIGHQMEGELGRRIRYDVAGVNRVICPWLHSNEIQQRPAKLHCFPHSHIVCMARIRTPITIQQLIIRHVVTIIVRAFEGSLNRQCCAWVSEHCWPKDAFLLIPDWHPFAAKHQAFIKRLGRDEPTLMASQPLDMIENSQPQFQIEV
jgi:hypothetical protein